MPPVATRPVADRRAPTLVAAVEAIVLALTAIVVAGPPSAMRAAIAPSVVQPAYVRTIGGAAPAIMYPSGVAADSSGNVYVADTGNDKVEKYQAGTTNLLWSVGVRGAAIGPAGSGNDSFLAPRDVAVDATRVYVADTDDAMIQVLNASDGSFVRQVASPGVGHDFSSPIGISVGTDGIGAERILVSDGVTGFVYVFDPAFNLLLSIPPTKPNEGTRDAATDSAGNIYTADYLASRVDKYDPTDSTGGTPLTSWGSNLRSDCHHVTKPYGIAVDTTDVPNRVYVASTTLGQAKVFDTSGNCLNVGATGSNGIGGKTTDPSDSRGIFQMKRVAVGPGSNPLVYAADLWGLKVLTYNSSDGSVASVNQPQLGNGQYPPAGSLNKAHSLAVDPGTNHVFAINTINQRVERFDLDGANPMNWVVDSIVENASSFDGAEGIARDPASGNVWVVNTMNNRMDEFTSAGAPVMSFPPVGRVSTIFKWPMAAAFDGAGNMYVADTFHNRVVAFSISGTTVTQLWSAGTIGSGIGQFIQPWSLVLDGTHSPARLLVADSHNNRIVSLDPATGAWNSTQPAISRGTGPGYVLQPEGVTVDRLGNIWVADTGNDRVEEFTAAGAFAGQMIGGYGITGNASFNAPQGIGFDDSATQLLYVADANNNRIQVYRPSSGPPTYRSNFFNAGGVAPMYPSGGAAAGGNMYIADSGANRIDKIDSNHNLSYIVPTSGSLANPRDLSIDVSTPANLWITDTFNNQLVEMNTSGQVLQTFGPHSPFPLDLKSPFGNTNDASNVYVADTYDKRVVAVSKTDGHTVWSADSCAVAIPAILSRVRDIALGSDGNVYATDTDQRRIVEFSPAGACLEAWDGSATGTTFVAPRTLASDGKSGLWIADAGGVATLYHFSNDGTKLIGKTTDLGGLMQPEGVFRSGANKIVVADPFAFQVVIFTVSPGGVPSATGTPLTFGTPAVGGFNNPFGVAYAPNGDLFVSDMFNQRLEKFSAATSTWTAKGQFGGGKGNMQNPRGISISPDGLTVILTNSENERIDLFRASDLRFQKSIVPTCGKMFFPHQTAYDQLHGAYWIADTNNHRVLEVDSSGNCLQNWGGGGLFNTPRGIAWDGTSVWVADAELGEVLQCTPAGSCAVVARANGTPTKVLSPWNLTIANGALWIADEGAMKIVGMALTGDPLFSFGGPGNDPSLGEFVSPRSVSINPINGDFVVADFGANVISIWH